MFIAAVTPPARLSKLLFSLFSEDFRKDFVSEEKIPQTKLLGHKWLLAADFLKEVSF